MKHRLFLIAALIACVLGGLAASAAEEGRIIEQRIVKNIDGTNSDFLFFYTNTTDLTFHVQAFHTNNHHLILSTEQNDVDFGVFKFQFVGIIK